jgi:3-phenylpropionate/trans-cinnamate dioxygenase ferredoxin reductase subunit
VQLDGGRELRFDRLLLATGAEPRRLPLPGAELEGVHYLRTLADCDLLRELLHAPVRLAVIGAGWIGCELAATARQRGAEVTIIEPLSVPLERVLGREVGAVYLELHREHSVQVLCGTGVEALEGDGGAVQRVLTSDGRPVECDLVAIGVGVAPRVQLAQDAGLKLDNGVAVDQSLRTSAENIFAAGDVANAWHPFYERAIRVEHWANALNQGPAAARAMLGQEVSYERIPYFFSDQYDVGMEYSGYATEWDEVLFRGDPLSREFIAFWVRDGRVLAGMNVNVWDVTEPIQQLIHSRAALPPERLTDQSTSLEELASEVSTSASGEGG